MSINTCSWVLFIAAVKYEWKKKAVKLVFEVALTKEKSGSSYQPKFHKYKSYRISTDRVPVT